MYIFRLINFNIIINILLIFLEKEKNVFICNFYLIKIFVEIVIIWDI